MKIHAEKGSILGGVHLELTGEVNEEGFSVTECVGGSMELADEDLSTNYQTFCDPRVRSRSFSSSPLYLNTNYVSSSLTVELRTKSGCRVLDLGSSSGCKEGGGERGETVGCAQRPDGGQRQEGGHEIKPGWEVYSNDNVSRAPWFPIPDPRSQLTLALSVI